MVVAVAAAEWEEEWTSHPEVVQAMILTEAAWIRPREMEWAATSLLVGVWEEVINPLVEVWEVTNPLASKVALVVGWSSSSSRKASKLQKALPRARVGDVNVTNYTAIFSDTSALIQYIIEHLFQDS
jgi:hypothetical protein